MLEYTNEGTGGTGQKMIACKKRSLGIIRPNSGQLTAAVEGPLQESARLERNEMMIKIARPLM